MKFNVPQGLEEARQFFAPRYQLPADAGWRELQEADQAKMDYAARYPSGTAAVVHAGAVPEMVEADVLRNILRDLGDGIFNHPKLAPLREVLFREDPLLDFNAYRSLLSETFGTDASLDSVMAQIHGEQLEERRARVELNEDVGRDELVNKEVGFSNAERSGADCWDNDLDYGVPATFVKKWQGIKDLKSHIDEAPQESPLSVFRPLLTYFSQLPSGDRLPGREDPRDPAAVQLLMRLLEQTSWETIDAEQDRSKRNYIGSRWPVPRNASWQDLMNMFEAAYNETVHHGRVVLDRRAAGELGVEVRRVRDALSQTLVDQNAIPLAGSYSLGLKELFGHAEVESQRSGFTPAFFRVLAGGER